MKEAKLPTATTRIPSAVSVEPPERVRAGGRAPVHTPDVLVEIAKLATTRWASNGLEYKSKSSAQAAAQRVKTMLVEGGHFAAAKDLRSTVYSKNGDDGPYVFAVRAK